MLIYFISLWIKLYFFSINTDAVSLMHIMLARYLKNPLNRNSRHGINQIENTLHIKHPVLLNKTTFIVNQTNNRYAYCFFITIYKITVTAGIFITCPYFILLLNIKQLVIRLL